MPALHGGLAPPIRRPRRAPTTGGDGTSSIVYILPLALLCLLIVAGMGYAVRTSGRVPAARASAPDAPVAGATDRSRRPKGN